MGDVAVVTADCYQTSSSCDGVVRGDQVRVCRDLSNPPGACAVNIFGCNADACYGASLAGGIPCGLFGRRRLMAVEGAPAREEICSNNDFHLFHALSHSEKLHTASRLYCKEPNHVISIEVLEQMMLEYSVTTCDGYDNAYFE